jgi:hypothetical protein
MPNGSALNAKWGGKRLCENRAEKYPVAESYAEKSKPQALLA